MKQKTVFILGAGFSAPAGIPLQNDLLTRVIEEQEDRSEFPWFGGPRQIKQGSVKRFIEEVYGLNREQIKKLELEDFFTPIHQCLANNESLKSIPSGRLMLVQRNLTYLLANAINDGHNEDDEGYIQTFVELICDYLNEKRSVDRCSIISLNWDIVLDRIGFRTTSENDGCLDYCSHCVGADAESSIEPGLKAKAKGKFLLKLMKLHGSLNWAACPNCQRLFVNKESKYGLLAMSEFKRCRFCKKTNLEHSILLPTFRKDITKFHYQHIWNQAGIELSEATRLVFIGYSFPLADFDFRSLITKYVGDVKVDVVLYDRDHPDRTDDDGVGQAYRNYFGDKIDNIYYKGVQDWIANHMDEVLP